MAQSRNQTTAVLSVLLVTVSLWLPAALAGRVPSASVAGPVTATYTLPLVA